MDVYGLMGNPVEHSLSPPMHNAGFEALDIDATYGTFETHPDLLEAALRGASALGIAGVNVTVPFKQDVLSFVDPEEIATRIGAVNTIDFGTDPPTGYNTDAHGARRALEHHDAEIADSTAVVVGAGGAARAIGYMLADAGADPHIANRTEHRAVELADDIGGTAHPLSAVGSIIETADVLINATSVGMEEDASPVREEGLHEGLVVMDAVYSPLETRLLRDASAVGATTIDGSWMLLYQGVRAFEIWTERDPPVEAMRSALRTALAD